jgi:hypothetical protein
LLTVHFRNAIAILLSDKPFLIRLNMFGLHFFGTIQETVTLPFVLYQSLAFNDLEAIFAIGTAHLLEQFRCIEKLFIINGFG